MLVKCRNICDALRDLVPFAQFKEMKNSHTGVFLLVKLQALATLVKVTLLHGYFSCFLNRTNEIKSLCVTRNIIILLIVIKIF